MHYRRAGSFLALSVSLSLNLACSSEAPPGGSGGGSSNAGSTGVSGAGSTGLPGGGNTGLPGGGNTGLPGGGTAGATSGGTAGTASGGTGGAPAPGGAGYWTSKDWHGCSWTGKGAFGTTSITPADFTTKPPADPYCASGVVGPEPAFKSVALMGFNVNEPATASCASRPVDTTMPGPPGVTPQSTGIAVNFVKRGANTAFTWRVQIQGPNGALDGAAGEADRWCATITEVQGKVHIPYGSFTPRCWEMMPAMRGTPYAMQPISAVVFTVPGDDDMPVPYDFCVNGLSYGTTAADAPDGPAVGTQMGTVGGPGVNQDFARAKVVVDGEQYIIQNNNWGNPSGTDLLLTYSNNSFVVTSGSGTGGDAPASFPSIYIGNNGNTMNGVYSTKTTDNLPAQISTITSISSSFRYSGTTNQFNAAYDIWFANSPPTAEYQDGINGFVMIWLRDPTGKQPIGNREQNPVMIADQPWNVWVGPRGVGPTGMFNNAPVVSFTNPAEDNDSRNQSFVNKNIKLFIDAAATRGIPSTMYLTDVFAGFEIWNGGGGGNLKVDEFKAVVNK